MYFTVTSLWVSNQRFVGKLSIIFFSQLIHVYMNIFQRHTLEGKKYLYHCNQSITLDENIHFSFINESYYSATTIEILIETGRNILKNRDMTWDTVPSRSKVQPDFLKKQFLEIYLNIVVCIWPIPDKDGAYVLFTVYTVMQCTMAKNKSHDITQYGYDVTVKVRS